MNQPRFVVEIARSVPAQDVGRAASYIAGRLGIDEARIRTLLGGRTGPVTRDVPADKADAIAKVFREAGVMVTIVERSTVASQFSQPEPFAPQPLPQRPPNREPLDHGSSRAADEPAGGAGDEPPDTQLENQLDDQPGEPPADYEYQEPPGRRGSRPSADTPPWELDDAWQAEAEDDAVPWRVDEPAREESPQPPPAHETEDAPSLALEPGPGIDDLRPSSTRWVPSPHEDPAAAPGQGAASLPADAYDDELDEWPLSIPDDEPLPPQRAAGGALDPFALEEDERPPGLWLAPDRSRFGDLESTPGERPRLRIYLLWALVASVVLLVILQLAFSAGGPAAGGSSYEAGLLPYRSGDFAAARRAWEGAAAGGDPRAQFMLGYMVQNGLGQPWSNARAAQWYQRAASQGLPEAQVALARLYLEGLGVEPDAEVGVALLRTAAASGHPAALYQYAELQFHGRWIEQDFEAALASFAAAAAGGSADAADYVALADFLQARAAGALAGDPPAE